MEQNEWEKWKDVIELIHKSVAQGKSIPEILDGLQFGVVYVIASINAEEERKRVLESLISDSAKVGVRKTMGEIREIMTNANKR